MSNFPIVEIIQLMLAPGIMISACGLLILGMNNKYSIVVNRVRLLTEERRRLFLRAGDKGLTGDENMRIESISLQLNHLVFRVRLVRNAVVAYTVAVAFFILTSLFIGTLHFFKIEPVNYAITLLFLTGMICVLIGIISAAYESIKGYQIIQLEVKIDE